MLGRATEVRCLMQTRWPSHRGLFLSQWGLRPSPALGIWLWETFVVLLMWHLRQVAPLRSWHSVRWSHLLRRAKCHGTGQRRQVWRPIYTVFPIWPHQSTNFWLALPGNAEGQHLERYIVCSIHLNWETDTDVRLISFLWDSADEALRLWQHYWDTKSTCIFYCLCKKTCLEQLVKLQEAAEGSSWF